MEYEYRPMNSDEKREAMRVLMEMRQLEKNLRGEGMLHTQEMPDGSIVSATPERMNQIQRHYNKNQR